jgi:hypothetical protein
MRTRYKVAAMALSLSGIAIGLWSGLAVQSTTIEQADCNSHDPLSGCAAKPEFGIPAGDVLLVGEPELASAAATGDDNLAIIRFAPKAEAADITAFLVANKATLVDGPRMGGLYTLQLHETGKAKAELIKQMQAQSAIVDFIATVH